jgi:hypothetical protein
MVKVKHLGAAKPDSEVFKRGYTINLTPNPPKKEPEKKEPKTESK